MTRKARVLGWLLVLMLELQSAWIAWNLRSLGSAALALLAGAAVAGSAMWTLRAPKLTAIATSAIVFTASQVAVNCLALNGWLLFASLTLACASGLALLVGAARAIAGIGPRSKSAVLTVCAIGEGLFAFAAVVPAADSYIGKYYMIPAASVTIQGVSDGGYVHVSLAGRSGRNIQVTLTEGLHRLTYCVVMPVGHRRSVGRCALAPRIPYYTIGDLIYADAASPEPEERVADWPDPQLVVGAKSVEFTISGGRRVRAEWW